MIKINKLETHDRLLHFKKHQALNISEGAEDCLKKNPFSLALQQHSPYIYIFAHPRTIGHDERVSLFLSGLFNNFEEVPTHRMLWQPRLTKPEAQTNSYLFRAISNTDIMEICWLIPQKELWAQYKKGNITEHEIVKWSCEMFVKNKQELEKRAPDDLTDEQAQNIYQIVMREFEEEKRIKKIYEIKS